MTPPETSRLSRAMAVVVGVMAACAALALLVAPWGRTLALAALGLAVLAPVVRIVGVAATWRTRQDLPYLAAAALTVALLVGSTLLR